MSDINSYISVIYDGRFLRVHNLCKDDSDNWKRYFRQLIWSEEKMMGGRKQFVSFIPSSDKSNTLARGCPDPCDAYYNNTEIIIILLAAEN